MRHDLAIRGVRQLHLCDRPNLQPAAADINVGGTLALPDYVRDGDTLRSQAFGDADLPAPPHLASGRRNLRQNFPFRHRGAVILPLDVQFQSTLFGDYASHRWTLSHQIRHCDLVAMNGQAHRSERRDQCHDEQDQRQQEQSEKGFH